MVEKRITELTNGLQDKKRMDNMLTNLLRECEVCFMFKCVSDVFSQWN